MKTTSILISITVLIIIVYKIIKSKSSEEVSIPEPVLKKEPPKVYTKKKKSKVKKTTRKNKSEEIKNIDSITLKKPNKDEQTN